MARPAHQSDLLIHAIIGKYHPGTPREKAELASQMVEKKRALEALDEARKDVGRYEPHPAKKPARKPTDNLGRVKLLSGATLSTPRASALKGPTK